jgi:hypothetical protein
MTDTIVIQPQINTLTITEDVNDIVISSAGAQGIQGPAGATGATGATGAQGSSGVVSVTAPITNSGTSTSANIGISAGSTSAAGALQLTDSISSTSTTTAATPNAVKETFDSIPSLAKLTGQYYRTPNTSISTGINPTTNRLFVTPIYLDRTLTLDRLGAVSGPGFVGTSSVRLGIYDNLNGKPNALILDAGTVSFTTNNTTLQITVSQSLSKGFYWLAFCQQSAPTTAAYWGQTQGQTASNIYMFGSSTPTGSLNVSFSQSSVTGALPSNISTTSSPFENSPYVWARFA